MSIQKRTVFFDYTDGVVRFWDWAQVKTTLGTMVEPFTPGVRYDFSAQLEYDPTDEIARIDEMRALDVDKSGIVLSSNTVQVLHGGITMPRDGR